MNNPLDTTLVDSAIRFAVDAHSGTERRGKGFPYIIHPLEAMEIVATITNDPEMLAAAVLHDTVEDTDVTTEDIRKIFGERVSRLVVSDTSDSTLGWRERRRGVMDRLARSAWEDKVVAIGDKLSNLRAVYRDYKQGGESFWSRFHAPNGKADYEWYYRELGWALIDLSETEAYREYMDLLEKTFGKEISAPHQIDIREYEESGAGYNAVSYNYRYGKTMVKMYREGVDRAVPEQELRQSRNVRSLGLNTPLAGRLVWDGKRYGAEFVRVEGKRSFARAISQNPEDMTLYAERFAYLCKELHNTPCSQNDFESEVDFYHRIINQNTDYSASEKQRLHEFVNQVPVEYTCIHGDLHIGNILTANGKDFWIDLGDFRWGNHWFDLGMLYFVCKCWREEPVFELFHISKDQMAQVWDVFARIYFSTDAPGTLSEIERKVRPFAALKLLHLRSLGLHYPEGDDMIRKELLGEL